MVFQNTLAEDLVTEPFTIEPANPIIYSLCIPRVKTNYGKRRLEYRGVIAWNNLTNDLKGTMSTFSFRKQLTTFLHNAQ